MAPELRSLNAVVFLFFFKASGAVFEASGMAEALGVSTTTDAASGKFEAAENASSGFQPAGGANLDFFTVATQAFDVLGAFFDILFQTELLLQNIGVPLWLTVFLTSPLYVIIFRDVFYIFRGA